MALMTPRGLKIRLELPWAFGLMARLWTNDPRTDAFRVLKTCEAIEEVPSVIAYAAALTAALCAAWPPWSITLAMLTGAVLGTLLTQFGLFTLIRPLGLLFLGYFWSWISGYGLLLVAGLVAAWAAQGWQGPLWWFAGIFASFLARHGVDSVFQFRFYRLLGQPFTAAEVNFFNAYRLHADRLGLARDLQVSDAEIETGDWRECLLDYAVKWPEAVARFPDKHELMRAMSDLAGPA